MFKYHAVSFILIGAMGTGTEAASGSAPTVTPGAPVQSPKSAGSSKSTAPQVLASPMPLKFIGDWVALGSGCRAKHDLPGDVSLELLSETATSYKVRFLLPKFKLSALAGDDKTPLAFARECAIRLPLNTTTKKRIKLITASTGVFLNKTKEVDASAFMELKLGTSTIGSKHFRMKIDEEVRNKEEQIILVPGKKPEESFPKLKCGEAKIVGFDFSFQAKRKTSKEEALFDLLGDKALEFTIDLEDCK